MRSIRLQRSVVSRMSQKPVPYFSEEINETLYAGSSGSFTSYKYGLNHEKIKVSKTRYRGNKIRTTRRVPFRRKRTERRSWVVEKTLERKGIRQYYSYTWRWRRFSVPRRSLRARECYDAVSGLPLKKISVPPKSMIYPKGMQRETITVYKYVYYETKPGQEKK